MAELEPISIQQLVRASGNANALDVFVNANASTMVFRPAAEPIETLEYWRNYMSALAVGKNGVDAAITSMTVATGAAGTAASVVTGGTPTARTFALTVPRGDKGVDGSFTQKAYTTYALMDAGRTSIPANTSVTVTNDTDSTKNGMYAYNGTVFTKSTYDPLIEMDSRLPVIYSTNPVIDVADNKYTALNTTGKFINATDAVITDNTSGVFTAIAVVAGQRVVINNTISPTASLVVSYGNTATPATGVTLTKATVAKIGSVQVSIVPAGMTYVLMNVALSSINLNIVNTLVVNLENPAVGSYKNYPLRDELAQTKLKDTLTEADLNLTHDNPKFNLYKPSTTTILGKYLNANSSPKGIISSATGLKLAQIPVVAGQTYTLYATDFRSDYFVSSTAALSMADGATTTSYISALVTANVMTFTVPAGHAWLFINLVVPSGSFDITSSLFVNEGTTSTRNIRGSISTLLGYEFKDIDAHARIDTILGVTPATVAPNSVLKDKTWAAIGDSITEKNFRATTNYHDYVKSDVGSMTVYNYGTSGTGFFSRFDAATKVTQKDADYVTIALGTNDWNHGNKALGDFLDVGTTTINGCINTTLTDVLTQFPKAKVAVITPLPRLNNWGTNGANNAYNYNLEILTNLLIKYCSHYSIPCLDLYHNSNLPVWIPAANTYYFTAPGYGSPDGLHPNDAGQRVMADKIRPFLESI